MQGVPKRLVLPAIVLIATGFGSTAGAQEWSFAFSPFHPAVEPSDGPALPVSDLGQPRDLFAGLRYSLSDRAALVGGWQHMSIEREDGAFVLDTSQSGPLIGFMIHF